MHAVMTANHVDALKKKRVFFTQDGHNRFGHDQTVVFEEDTAIEPYSATLNGVELSTIGAFSYSSSSLPASTKIGRYCSIAWNVRVMAHNHHTHFVTTSSLSYDPHFIIFNQCLEDHGVSEIARYGGHATRPNRNDPPIIEHDVWIGQDALLGRGIVLGTGCIVGAGAVVTKSVPPYAIVGGNPAKLIRFRFEQDLIDGLLASRWWRYKVSDLAGTRYDDPSTFLIQIRQGREHGILPPYEPEPILMK